MRRVTLALDQTRILRYSHASHIFKAILPSQLKYYVTGYSILHILYISITLYKTLRNSERWPDILYQVAFTRNKMPTLYWQNKPEIEIKHDRPEVTHA